MSPGALQSIDFVFVARKEVRAMFMKFMEGSLQVPNGCLAPGLRLLGMVVVVVLGVCSSRLRRREQQRSWHCVALETR